jgi:hypothetical protein
VYCRLNVPAIATRHGQHAFFQKIATGDWMELRKEKVEPGFWRFLTTRPANVGFSPCGWAAPSESSVRRDEVLLAWHSSRVRFARSPSARARHRARD